jgi:prepilin-type N-terminal cleavage/methylation domain-containing protein
MKAKGFTLLEVMIATTIALFVAAAGQTFFTSSFNFSVLHGRNLEMQRESRVALDLISREIRNGGVGLRNPFKRSAVFPIVGALQTIIPGNNLDPDPSGVAAKLDRITVQTVQQIGRLT